MGHPKSILRDPGTFLHRRGTWPRCWHTLRSLGKDWRSGCSKSTFKTAGERSQERNTKQHLLAKKVRISDGWFSFGWLVWGCGMVSNPPSIYGVTKDLPRKNMQHLQGRDVGVGWDAVLGWVGWGCGLTMIEYG